MAVYVDDMHMLATVGRLKARWSHLTADTEEELHEFAARLGLSRRTAQFPGTWKSHYDVTDFMRNRAMELGAVSIGYRSAEALALLRRKRALRSPWVQFGLPLDLSPQQPAIGRGTAGVP
ncbi:DUF4031 domain-containing protein [Mycobacterium marseillense]|uniref:DUF4031 domain-containing protein n=1 Tax=Mycobacterium marseillense TaxID=701042 RepID=UPI0011A08505|nr:DUF4031 domain-containing protein [Mycobacterium marseillense]